MSRAEHAGLRIACVVGPSDAGKTTLIERLVPRLAERGRVGTVKSIHHEVEVDTPGKDTHRHREAGADAVIGVTPAVTFEIASAGKREPPSDPDAGWLFDADARTDPELRALEAALARFHRRRYDVVLVEGFTQAPLPTIVVGDRPSISGEVIGRGDDDLEELLEAVWALEPVGRDGDPKLDP